MSENGAAFNLSVPAEAARPLARALLAEWLADVDQVAAKLGVDQIAYDEQHASRLCGMESWQLRDLRLAGKIPFCRVGAKKVRYLRSDLLNFLMAGRMVVDATSRPKARIFDKGDRASGT